MQSRASALGWLALRLSLLAGAGALLVLLLETAAYAPWQPLQASRMGLVVETHIALLLLAALAASSRRPASWWLLLAVPCSFALTLTWSLGLPWLAGDVPSRQLWVWAPGVRFFAGGSLALLPWLFARGTRASFGVGLGGLPALAHEEATLEGLARRLRRTPAAVRQALAHLAGRGEFLGAVDDATGEVLPPEAASAEDGLHRCHECAAAFRDAAADHCPTCGVTFFVREGTRSLEPSTAPREKAPAAVGLLVAALLVAATARLLHALSVLVATLSAQAMSGIGFPLLAASTMLVLVFGGVALLLKRRRRGANGLALVLLGVGAVATAARVAFNIYVELESAFILGFAPPPSISYLSFFEPLDVASLVVVLLLLWTTSRPAVRQYFNGLPPRALQRRLAADGYLDFAHIGAQLRLPAHLVPSATRRLAQTHFDCAHVDFANACLIDAEEMSDVEAARYCSECGCPRTIMAWGARCGYCGLAVVETPQGYRDAAED